MESFSVRSSFTEKDWQAYMSAAQSRMANAKRADASWLMRLAPTVVIFALLAVLTVMVLRKPPLLQPEGLLLLVATFAGFIWVLRWVQRRAAAPMKDGSFLGDVELEFGPDGFRSRRPRSETFIRWSLVNGVTQSPAHLFVWVDAFSAYVLPTRDLPAGMTPSEAAIRIQELMAAAALAPAESATSGASPLASGATIPVQIARARSPIRPGVAQELRALLRLHTWRLVDGARLFGRDVTILLLSVFSFVLWASLDRLNYEGDVELFYYGLSDIAVLALAVLSVAWLISRVTRPRIELRRGLLLTLGLLPLFVLVLWLAGFMPQAGGIVVAILLAACADRYLRAGLVSMTGTTQNLAVPATLLGTVLLVYLSCQVYFSPGIWTESDPDAEVTAEDQRKNEQIVFEQSARINADIAALAPREAGRANVFFVGFAGFGAQSVFADEISLAAKRVDERYGAAHRSVLLVNDERDSLKYPLASGPSLRHALNALSQRMNVEEDVLFLALSSHGSEEGTVSVASELGIWRDLGATDLADMLRESGIRWRVIVVSACYAGAFVEPLRNDNTIILTAAAADRTSFGCSDDNDLTYFGEAFYRDALPKATSLRAAFDTARAAILEREKQEGVTPSNPQAYFGAAIEQKLATMEAGGSPLRQLGGAHEPAVALARGSAAFVDGPHDQ
jgi:hypothetical protein